MNNDVTEPRHEDDRELLGCLCAPKLSIGFVDEVNGPGSVECPDFRPSRHELEVLAKYWSDRHLSSETFCWLYSQVGSEDIRIQPYASRRLHRIAAILGTNRVDAVVQQVEAKYRQQLGDDAWNAFKRGDEQWRDRELNRINEDMRKES